MSTLKSDPVAILLAAGESTRMGKDKLLAMLGKKRVIEHALRGYRKATRVQDIILVVRPGATELYEPLRTPQLHIVENPDPSAGMITSIRAGLDCTWAAERNFLIAPADVPFVPPEIIDQIVTTFVTRDCKIVIPTYQGLGGHPGLFAKELSRDFHLRGDTNGAREILFRHQKDTVRLNVPEPDICFDIDRPEDLEHALDPGARWARVEELVEQKKKPRLR
ncbi:MAG: nucleotidyltransferase family protein [Planctomycetota bacterium]|nr:nucleotidyltransferase family protein [Planctomycetota bacterium]